MNRQRPMKCFGPSKQTAQSSTVIGPIVTGCFAGRSLQTGQRFTRTATAGSARAGTAAAVLPAGGRRLWEKSGPGAARRAPSVAPAPTSFGGFVFTRLIVVRSSEHVGQPEHELSCRFEVVEAGRVASVLGVVHGVDLTSCRRSSPAPRRSPRRSDHHPGRSRPPHQLLPRAAATSTTRAQQ